MTAAANATPRIAGSVRLGYTELHGQTYNGFFGTTRRDRITKLSARASFTQLETVLGRPYPGVVHDMSNSNYPTRDYDRTSLDIGITKSI